MAIYPDFRDVGRGTLRFIPYKKQAREQKAPSPSNHNKLINSSKMNSVSFGPLEASGWN